MFLRFGRNLTFAICIALQLLALAVCPCQLGDEGRSAVAAPAKPGNSENAECYLCRGNSEARPACRSSLLERESGAAAAVSGAGISVDPVSVPQCVAVLALTELSVLDLVEFQVFLE